AIAQAVANYRAVRDGQTANINTSTLDSTEGASSSYKPTHQQKALSQASAPVASDLIDSSTGARYTRSALLHLIKTDLNKFRELRRQNEVLLNDILAHRA